MAKGKSNLIVEIGGKVGASFKKSIKQTQNSVSSLSKNVSREMNNAAAASAKGFKNVLRNDAFQAAAVGAAALGAGIMGSVKAAVDFESAMSDVKKVVDFESPKGFKNLQSDIRALAREIPITAAGFAEIVASAGQAGVANDELTRFAESAAKMGVAFDISAKDAGDAMAKFRTAMGLDQDQVEALADSINHLSNNFAATAAETTNFMMRVGALKGQMAISEQSIAAFGTAMIGAGAAPEVAATSFRNLTKALMKGDAATKSQMAAFDQLGLSSSQLAKDMQKDAEGTILDVFARLAKAPAELRNSLSTQMFGSEARALTPLLTNTENLKKALDSVASSELFSGSMQAEFAERSKTAANAQIIFKNNLNDLGIAVGSVLLPALTDLMKGLAPVIAGFANFADANPGLTKGLVVLAGAFVGVVAVAPFVASLVGLLGSLKLALIGASAAGTVAGGVLAILTSPITLTIAAIVGLVAGFTLLYNKVDWFKAGVDGTLNFLGSAWQNLSSLIQNVWATAIGYITPIFEAWKTSFMGVVQVVQGIWQVFTGIFTGDSETAVEGVKNIFGGLKAWFGGFVDGLKAIFAPAAQPLLDAFNSVVTFLQPVIDGIKSIFNGLTTVLVHSWQAFTSLLSGDFEGAMMNVETVAFGLKEIFGTIIGGLKVIWDGLVTHVKGIGTQIVDTFLALPEKLKGVGQAIINTIRDGFISRFTALKDTVVNSFKEIRKLLPFSDAKKGPFKDLTKSGRSIVTTLADGVRDRQSTLRKAMTQAADVSTTAFDKKLESKITASPTLQIESQNVEDNFEPSNKSTRANPLVNDMQPTVAAPPALQIAAPPPLKINPLLDVATFIQKAITDAANVTGDAFTSALAPLLGVQQLAFAGGPAIESKPIFGSNQNSKAAPAPAAPLFNDDALRAAKTTSAPAAPATLAPVVNVSVANANASPEEIATVVTTALQDMLSDAESDQRAGLND